MALHKRLKSGDLFDELEREEEQEEDRKKNFEKDPALREIIRLFESTYNDYLDFSSKYREITSIDYYEYISEDSEHYLPREYSAKDIENFSLCLEKYQHKRRFGGFVGVYLSNLINFCFEETFNLQLAYLESLLSNLGMENKKTIFIHGDCYDVGSSNKGEIVVYGNIFDDVGLFLEGGKIIVRGNVKGNIGEEMTGGTIEVFGDVGGIVGEGMKRGRIDLHGNYKKLGMSSESKAEVYHKGRRVR